MLVRFPNVRLGVHVYVSLETGTSPAGFGIPTVHISRCTVSNFLEFVIFSKVIVVFLRQWHA